MVFLMEKGTNNYYSIEVLDKHLKLRVHVPVNQTVSIVVTISVFQYRRHLAIWMKKRRREKNLEYAVKQSMKVVDTSLSLKALSVKASAPGITL